jgi:hypothetical protein
MSSRLGTGPAISLQLCVQLCRAQANLASLGQQQAGSRRGGSLAGVCVVLDVLQGAAAPVVKPARRRRFHVCLVHGRRMSHAEVRGMMACRLSSMCAPPFRCASACARVRARRAPSPPPLSAPAPPAHRSLSVQMSV